MNYALEEYMSSLQGSSVVGISEQCPANTAYYMASLWDLKNNQAFPSLVKSGGKMPPVHIPSLQLAGD